jgi:hypothetical protein
MKKIVGLIILSALFLTIPVLGKTNSNRNSANDPFIKQIAKALRDIYPGYLASRALGQELARNAPVIMNRLRQTRYAIQSLGGGTLDTRSPRVQSKPFSFVRYERDRRTLIRNISDLEYLINGYRNEPDSSRKYEWMTAISRKFSQIDRTFTIYLGKSVGAFLAEQNRSSSNVSAVWTSSYGNIKWTVNGNSVRGTYGNNRGTLTGTLRRVGNKQILSGTWVNARNQRGTFVFTFNSGTSFSGTWKSADGRNSGRWTGNARR